VALIGSHTRDGIGSGTSTSLATIRLRAQIIVIASGAVGFVGIGAHTRGRIACSYVVALIQSRARNGIGSGTSASTARIGLRASIAVIANSAVGLVGIGAHAVHRIANTGVVALIQSRTNDGHCAGTCSRLAGIHLRAAIAVIAHGSIGFRRIGAHARHGIARAHVVALAQRCTRDRVCPGTGACLATIRLRASIVVIARCAVGLVGIGAHARCWIAHAGVMAKVERRASNWVCPSTRTGLTAIRLRTGISVITNRTIGFRRIGARTSTWIANARIVALAERRTNDRVCPGTGASLTRIRLRTGISVATNRAIGLRRIRTRSRAGLACSWIVALAERRTRCNLTTHAIDTETARAIGANLTSPAKSCACARISIHRVCRRCEIDVNRATSDQRVTIGQRRRRRL
jgi:hypothetical protein